MVILAAALAIVVVLVENNELCRDVVDMVLTRDVTVVEMRHRVVVGEMIVTNADVNDGPPPPPARKDDNNVRLRRKQTSAPPRDVRRRWLVMAEREPRQSQNRGTICMLSYRRYLFEATKKHIP